MNLVSRVTKGVIKHRLFERAEDIFIPLCRDAADGIVVALLGPTQSGKSLIFRQAVQELRNSFKDSRPGALPILDLQIETVSEGRTKPKWLGIELLKLLQHPMYKHIGSFDEDKHYRPSKGRDESTIRIAMKEGFNNRFTRRICLDELHLLTRTKDPDLRAAILESVKSTCAIDRSLIACGGYEVAYKGLFDSPHFCGRVLSVDFGHYSTDVPEDVSAFLRILKTYSPKLDLKYKNLLTDNTINLLNWNNGTVGLLDKHLWACSVHAKALHKPIDKALLEACSPAELERRSIERDIREGRAALMATSRFAGTPVSTRSKGEGNSRASVPPQKSAPFERKPNRNAAKEVVLHVDD